jgi:hypothetical protein
MQGYALARDDAFARSRECFGELEDWLASGMRRSCSMLTWRNGWRSGGGSWCGCCTRPGWI